MSMQERRLAIERKSIKCPCRRPSHDRHWKLTLEAPDICAKASYSHECHLAATTAHRTAPQPELSGGALLDTVTWGVWGRAGAAQPLRSSSSQLRAQTVPRPAAWPPSSSHSALPSTLPASDRLRDSDLAGAEIGAAVVENAFAAQNTRLCLLSGPRGRPSTGLDPSPQEVNSDGGNARTLIPAGPIDGRAGRAALLGRTPGLAVSPRPAPAHHRTPYQESAPQHSAATLQRCSCTDHRAPVKRRAATVSAGGPRAAEAWRARRRAATTRRRSGGAASPGTGRSRRRRRR